VTMRDGNLRFFGRIVLVLKLSGFRSDYEGWKLKLSSSSGPSSE